MISDLAPKHDLECRQSTMISDLGPEKRSEMLAFKRVSAKTPTSAGDRGSRAGEKAQSPLQMQNDCIGPRLVPGLRVSHNGEV